MILCVIYYKYWQVSTISYKVCYWSTSGQKNAFKICGGEAAGRTAYTFYKPIVGPTYISNRPYNKFIT